MSVVDFLLFIISTIGATKIITEGKIAQPFRKWVKDTKPVYKMPSIVSKYLKIEEIALSDIVSCDQCCGFWLGAICGIFAMLPWWLVLNKIILLACASSYMCMLGGVFLDYWNAFLYMQEDKDEETTEST